MEAHERPARWLVLFRGGPWEGHSMLVEREPEQVIETRQDPSFRYRLSVKLGPVRPDRPERLIYEPD